MSLESYMLAQLQTKPEVERWVVAYSGGLDSTVLLHLVFKANQRLLSPKPVLALHINHQLSKQADNWQRHCEQQAQQWGLPFYSQTVNVRINGQGLEAAARDARYDVFSDFLQQGDCLLLGHHSDDQAETFLFRLVRGSGVQGLTAMPVQRTLGDGMLWRPLLDLAREELMAYARTKGLQWVDDDSNASQTFDRNYLRHEIIPLLENRWQKTRYQLSKTARHLQKTKQLLNDLAEMDLQKAGERAERLGTSLDWKQVKLLGVERINNLLRYWCMARGFALPDGKQLEQMQEQFFHFASPPTSSSVRWGQCELRQFNQRIYLLPAIDEFVAEVNMIPWSMADDLPLGTAGWLQAEKQWAVEPGQMLLKIDNKQLVTVRWRQGGERCQPVGRSNSQVLKKLLQEYQLETWLRDRVPLIYIEEQLAAVGDLWVCSDFAANVGEEGYQLHWYFS